MRLKKILAFLLIAVFGCGCGHVCVDPLPILEESAGQAHVAMVAHFLSNDDAVRFLGTNLKAAKAKALHVTLRNGSEKTYVLSKRDIIFPVKEVSMVVACEEQFTLGRAIAGWILGGFCGGFLGSMLGLEPQVAIGLGVLGELTGASVAAVSSSKHNENSRQILQEKTQFCSVLPPHSCINFVLFAPESLESDHIEVTLREQPNGEPLRVCND